LYMYRAMQIGVVLLAAGTILGGVWADYSWGRFWGWDPKEVWALIALLLYLAVLHGRFSGWLRGFGFAATTVVSFLGVLMAWYGVNFVLGVGLHSYGFGSGGMGWVMSYVGIQVAFIILGYFNYQKAKANHSLDTAIFPKR
ncbi:MAG: cytochrome c biogenesis protein CcsA, partial [Deltaproteobacteria bacterium]|nr:cytochrome c biogenesis protein CcsA [Deltaproteobacteria bacterium]